MKLKAIIFLFTVLMISCNASDKKTVKENRSLSGSFDKIEVSYGIKVQFVQNQNVQVEIEAQKNLIEKVTTEVISGTLYIKGDKDFINKNYDKEIIAYLHAPTINELSIIKSAYFVTSQLICDESLVLLINEGGDVEIQELQMPSILALNMKEGGDCEIGNLKTSTCNIDCAKACDLSIKNIHSTDISVNASGSCDIYLSGKTKNIILNTSGASDVNIRDLEYDSIVRNPSYEL